MRRGYLRHKASTMGSPRGFEDKLQEPPRISDFSRMHIAGCIYESLLLFCARRSIDVVTNVVNIHVSYLTSTIPISGAVTLCRFYSPRAAKMWTFALTMS